MVFNYRVNTITDKSRISLAQLPWADVRIPERVAFIVSFTGTSHDISNASRRQHTVPLLPEGIHSCSSGRLQTLRNSLYFSSFSDIHKQFKTFSK